MQSISIIFTSPTTFICLEDSASYTKHPVHDKKVTNSMKRKRSGRVLGGRKSQLVQCQSGIYGAADELHVATSTPSGHAVQVPCVEGLLSELHQAGNDWARVQCIIQKARRSPESVQITLLDHVIHKLYPYTGKPGQLKGLHRLIFERKDLLLIAKTSYGKSMLFQAPAVIQDSGIALLILPLNAIGEEQLAKIKLMPSAKPVLLNHATVNKRVLQDIKNGKHTHVLLGPEMALGPKFRPISTDPAFKSKVVMVAVDEAHLVEQWGNKFRQEYAKLMMLRERLGARVPWFACSATVSRRTFDLVMSRIGFDKQELMTIRTSVDRPEVSIIIEQMEQNTKGSYNSLYFLLDQAITEDGQLSPECIEKTIVFIDSKLNIQEAAFKLRQWLIAKGYSLQDAMKIVRIYHANVADADKKCISAIFHTEDSQIRIIIATEALGLGIDLSDVKRVVQYGSPVELAMEVLWQRFGRAVRGPGQKGVAIFIIESWMLGERLKKASAVEVVKQTHSRAHALPGDSGLSQVTLPDDNNMVDASDASDAEGEASKKQKQGRKTDAERRAEMSDAVWHLLNDDRCYRASFLEYFEDHRAEDAAQQAGDDLPTLSSSCCNWCNSSLQYITPLPPQPGSALKKGRNSPLATAAAQLLTEWAECQLKALYPNAWWSPCLQMFMPESILIKVVENISSITTIKELKGITQAWELWDTHGQSLWAYIPSLHHQAELVVAAKQTENKKKQEQSRLDKQKANREANLAIWLERGLLKQWPMPQAPRLPSAMPQRQAMPQLPASQSSRPLPSAPPMKKTPPRSQLSARMPHLEHYQRQPSFQPLSEQRILSDITNIQLLQTPPAPKADPGPAMRRSSRQGRGTNKTARQMMERFG